MKMRCIGCFLVLLPLLLGSCARNISSENPELQYSYAHAVAPFAAMSELAYKCPEKPKKPSLDYVRETDQRKTCLNAITRAGWTEELDFHQSSEENKVGLQYKAWINKSLKPNVLCVVFRGTEFLTEPADMQSNLHFFVDWATGPDQYDYVGSTVSKKFVEKYGARIKSGELVVITSGHSLGGGLAQHFMYRNPGVVTQCYAFDPSPVTGYTSLDKKTKDQILGLLPVDGFPDAQTVRVNQDGEILEPFRAVVSRFTYYSNQIDRITFDVSKDKLFKRQTFLSRHSISGLAVGLLRRGGYPVEGKYAAPKVWRKPWWENSGTH